MSEYKVFMTIRGSIVKPSYSGQVKVVADSYEDAIQKAITTCQNAHWDSPRDDFRVDKVEVWG